MAALNRQAVLETDIGGGLTLRNPLLTASGTFGYGEEYSEYQDLEKLGAVIVKGLSLLPRKGNPPPRIIETPAGMLNSIGLENVGVRAFISEKLPFLRRFDTKVIANVYGESIDEFREIVEILDGAPGVHGIEVNVSCPNVEKGGISFGADERLTAQVTRTVREATRLPVIVKLTPNVTDIASIAAAARDSGADAVSLINTLKGMSIDVETRRAHLGNITGGLSGPAIRPVAVRMVWETARRVSIPVIGIGGIISARDAIEFLIAGASAVQIGTANFLDPGAPMQILKGIMEYLDRHSIPDIKRLIGSLKQGGSHENC
ncbi:MAG TPA: dihydroorotate dehydrogenase [Syntrophales bacterium]|nr:dihydroorotate dehydrogenase [Syntrophales bacterium]